VVYLDHVIYGTRDLDETAAQLEQMYGLRFLPGGRHPGGTINRFAPLAPPQYFELLAVEEVSDSVTQEPNLRAGGGPPACSATARVSAAVEPTDGWSGSPGTSTCT
jgi:hypothetical protein